MANGGWVNIESDVSRDAIKELIRRGHDVRFDLTGFGGYQAIRVDPQTHVYFGASESRKDGQAAGW
jgi:gamma-glutamyltranspeptidase/glutathione hydrolase